MKTNAVIGGRFSKELLWLLNSYLNEDLLVVGTIRFMDLTTMGRQCFISFIHNLMAKKVLSNIISGVKTGKYFAISVDSTPDVSHMDQLTFIVRFVDSSGEPVERFMKFIPISGHDAETMTNVVHEHDLSIMDCRGQSYTMRATCLVNTEASKRESAK